ncbi:uncharacterized protein LOC121780119 [Salvia splendens]|uniref:uncharacterized protein LOC121780119 n=1 Tax=Salvia splendens TaxID=180675 RepID=UPI001C263CCD|nr:uncharacterized protein LOC121780119 [Salvia splendens]
MGIANYNEETIFHDQKSIFLPMFCRLSIKDVKLTTIPISSTAAAADPTSPIVSCMGQVKRNSRVSGYPSSATIISHHHHKHPNKPRKNTHFSTKTLLPAAAAAAAAGGRKSVSQSCRRKSRRPAARVSFDQELCSVKAAAAALDISKMDPPLPVVKRAAAEVNLWKRRFDGVKSMSIQPIRLPAKEFRPASAAVDDGTRFMQ